MYDIDKQQFQMFFKAFKDGAFPHQRLGQAFYNHFKLHKLGDQESLGELYELDGVAAEFLIKRLFVPSS